MQITIFGASGSVGRLVVSEALKRGYDVVAFVHNHNPFEELNHLTIVKGDIANSGDITKALLGSEAVISCLGSWGQPGRNVLTTAMTAIIPAMKAQKITRIITLTGSGAMAPDVTEGLGHKLFMKAMAPFPAGKVFHDGEQHMKLLAVSSLDWTSLRSPIMKSKGTSAYQLTSKASNARLPRSAVVAALIDQLTLTEYIYQAPIIKSA
ncbi:NAD(P)H-binding protein [Aeromicrobium sp.]|nr:NAD(P)H-binding protein [Candidatus Saccharibacteria bacterium]